MSETASLPIPKALPRDQPAENTDPIPGSGFTIKKKPDGSFYFNRPPRIQPKLPDEEFEIPDPPEPPDEDLSIPLLARILPALISMLPLILYAVFMINFSPVGMSGASLVLVRVAGPVLMLIATLLFGSKALNYSEEMTRRRQKEMEKRQQNNYNDRLDKVEEYLRTQHKSQRSILTRMNPPLAELKKRLPDWKGEDEMLFPDKRLWERRPGDDDFLCLRAGIGVQPSAVKVKYPDELDFVKPSYELERAVEIGKRYQYLYDAPILINLREQGAISIIGKRDKRLALIRAMLMQLVVHHAPNDVALYIISAQDKKRERARWDWVRYLPHCSADLLGGSGDYLARDPKSVQQLLEHLLSRLNRRRERADSDDDEDMDMPYIVLVVDDYSDEVRDHPVFTSIFHAAQTLRVAAIFLHEHLEEAPAQCTALLRLDMKNLPLWYGEVGPDGQRIPPAGWDVHDDRPPVQEKDGGRRSRRGRRSQEDDDSLFTHDPAWREIERQQKDEKGRNKILSPTTPDRCDLAQAKEFALTLRRVRLHTLGASGDIPPYVDFLDMYDKARRLEDLKLRTRWLNFPEEGKLPFPVPIGMTKGNKPLQFHLLEGEDGPHGLLAGTTGSGKSELLQTLVAALAVEHHPHFLSFFLIDYKGGSTFNMFKELPHTVGVVSDLAPDIAKRALIAIRSEIQYRKQVLNDATEASGSKVNDILAYHKLYTQYLNRRRNPEDPDSPPQNIPDRMVPIPHLVIIIDEFAELMKELPDFMPEMAQIARVGRSLGIHLILATQRPAGSVKDEVRANAQFAICLRVRSPEDSRDMIGQTDAAFLPNIPGRGYLRSGSDTPQLFQAAYIGATYDPNRRKSRSENVGDQAEAFTIYWTKDTRNTQPDPEGHYTYIPRSTRFEDLRKTVVNTQSESATAPSGTIVENLIRYIREVSEKLQDYIPLSQLWEEPLDSEIPLEEALYRHNLEERIRRGQMSGATDAQKRGAAEAARELELFKKPLEELSPEKRAKRQEIKWEWDLSLWQTSHDMSVILGILDDPATRQQRTLSIDLNDSHDRSHIAIYGEAGSGRSNFLRTAVTSLAQFHAPWELHIHILDMGVGHTLHPLTALPHTGTYATEMDTAKISRLIHWFGHEFHRRRGEARNKLFEHNRQALAAGNYSQVRPFLVLVIDGFGELAQEFDIGTGSRPEADILRQIAQHGPPLGIFLIMSGGNRTQDIPRAIMRGVQRRFAFPMSDDDQMQQVVGGRRPYLTGEAPPGRGMLRGSPPLEFQTATVGRGDLASARIMLHRLGKEMRQTLDSDSQRERYEALRPHEIGELEEQLFLSRILDDYDHVPNGLVSILCGRRYDDLEPHVITLGAAQGNILIAGHRASGRTTLLQTLALSTAWNYSPKELKILLIAPGAPPPTMIPNDVIALSTLAELPHLVQPPICTPKELKEALEWLSQEFKERSERAAEPPALLVLIDNAERIFAQEAPARRTQAAEPSMTFADLSQGFKDQWPIDGSAYNMRICFAASYLYLAGAGMLRSNLRSPFLKNLHSTSLVCATSSENAGGLGIQNKQIQDIQFVRGRGLVFDGAAQQPTPQIVQFAQQPPDKIADFIQKIRQKWGVSDEQQ